MDEGLGFALILPIFFLLIPVSISFALLYAILRNNTEFYGVDYWTTNSFVLAYVIPVSEGEGIIWHPARIDMVAVSPFAPYIIAAFFGMLTAFIGLIVIKIIGSVRVIGQAR